MTLEMAHETLNAQWTVVRMVGRLDAASAETFKHKVKELIHRGQHHFVLDFSLLRMLSSTGLNALLTVFRDLQKHQGEVRIANLQSYVREVFDLTGYSTMFKLYESVESASGD